MALNMIQHSVLLLFGVANVLSTMSPEEQYFAKRYPNLYRISKTIPRYFYTMDENDSKWKSGGCMKAGVLPGKFQLSGEISKGIIPILTPAFCAEACLKNQPATQIIVVEPKKCFCAVEYPVYAVLDPLDDERCNSSCPGDRLDKCGGIQAAEVFLQQNYPRNPGQREAMYSKMHKDIQDIIINHIEASDGFSVWKHAGCIKREAFGATKSLSQPQMLHLFMTPQVCLFVCHKEAKNYVFAAVQGGDCLCATAYSQNPDPMPEKCTKKCPGDHVMSCGGDYAVDVYTFLRERS